MTSDQLSEVHAIHEVCEEVSQAIGHSLHICVQITPAGYRFVYVYAFSETGDGAVEQWESVITPGFKELGVAGQKPLHQVRAEITDWAKSRLAQPAA